MSNITREPMLYDFDVNGHTYYVAFEGYHAFIYQGKYKWPLIPYMNNFIPQSLHVMFLRAIAYVKKEFAL